MDRSESLKTGERLPCCARSKLTTSIFFPIALIWYVLMHAACFYVVVTSKPRFLTSMPHPQVMKGVRRKRNPRGGGRGGQNRIPNRRPVVTLKLDETPPRRLVLKMVDLQEALTTMNSSIMTGLVVTSRQWEEFSAMVTKLEKIFREDIEFAWQAKNGRDSDSDVDQALVLPEKASSSGMGDEESEEELPMTERLESPE